MYTIHLYQMILQRFYAMWYDIFGDLLPDLATLISAAFCHCDLGMSKMPKNINLVIYNIGTEVDIFSKKIYWYDLKEIKLHCKLNMKQQTIQYRLPPLDTACWTLGIFCLEFTKFGGSTGCSRSREWNDNCLQLQWLAIQGLWLFKDTFDRAFVIVLG